MGKAKSINKKPIEDAKNPLSVYVTKKDASKGRKQDPMTCALARGATHDDRIISVRIGTKIALVEYEHKVVRYGLKSEDTEKIRAFDYAHYFQPGIYTLIVPRKRLGVHTVNHKRKSHSGSSGGGVARRHPMRHMWRLPKGKAK